MVSEELHYKLIFVLHSQFLYRATSSWFKSVVVETKVGESKGYLKEISSN